MGRSDHNIVTTLTAVYIPGFGLLYDVRSRALLYAEHGRVWASMGVRGGGGAGVIEKCFGN